MKPKMALAWFFVSVALAAMLVVQWRSGNKTKLLNEKLQLQVEHLDKEAKAAKATAAETQKEQQSLRSEVRGLELELNNARAAQGRALERSNQVASAKPPAAGPEGGKSQGGNPMNMLKQMMDDPEMAKVIKEQQRVMMDMMYGPLFKELGLTEEESTQFKEMLLNRQMNAMKHTGGLTEKDPELRKAAMETVAAENKDFENELKDFLGDDRYAKYQDFNTTLSERMTLNMFAQQSNLRPEQSEQLLQLMAQEKKAFQAQNPGASIDPNQDWQKLFEAGDAMDRHFQQQEQINASVLQKAQQYLTPDQVKAFGNYMKQQNDMARASMKMAQKMMGAEGTATPTPEPPVAVPAP